MHLVVGFVRIIVAYFLVAVYRRFHFDSIGRRIIRLSCAAFVAGAGLDDAAIDVVRILGDDGIRLLKIEIGLSQDRTNRLHTGPVSVARLMLMMLHPESEV
ncbi:MAG TPA: hypothetical protein VJ783_07120 [Pirellulales bacterium]|nr:hypothetical protein [Pirellulales bacterium]